MVKELSVAFQMEYRKQDGIPFDTIEAQHGAWASEHMQSMQDMLAEARGVCLASC